MMGPRHEKFIVSKKCAANLAQWILPEKDWQRLAALRFDRFLKSEGLDDIPRVEHQERSIDWQNTRERLFAFLLGSVAAACVLVSLSVLLGVSQPRDPSHSRCGISTPTTQVINSAQENGTSAYVLAIRP